MASLIDPDLVREFTDTDLSDTALQLLIDDAEGEIVRRYGAHDGGEITELHEPSYGEQVIFLRRPADTLEGVSLVTMRAKSGGEPVEADASSYQLEDPWQLRILSGCWHTSIVAITFTSEGEIARRKRVLLDLVKLSVRYEAAGATKLGDTQVTHVDYQTEREALLSSLASVIGGFA